MLHRMFVRPTVLLLCTAVVLMAFSGCQPKSRTAAPPPSNTRPLTSTRGYVIDVPNDWTTSSQSINYVDLIVMAPLPDMATFRTNLNVAYEQLPGAMTAEEYTRATLPNLQRILPAFAEASTADFTGKVTGKKVVYSWMTGDAQVIKACAYIFTRGTEGFVITGSSTPESFAQDEPTFDQMARSFRWQRK